MSDSADNDDAISAPEGEDTEGTLRGDSDSENESEGSAAGNGGGGFFDLEAADSEDDEESEESEEDSDASSDGGYVEPLFSRFMYLPPELRRRVWEFFCPEVLGIPRILEFVWDVASKEQPIVEGSSTTSATESSRALAAVDRETREIALRAFPDVLKLSGTRGDVRFSPMQDIVMIQHIRRLGDREELCLIPGFSDRIYYLAINLDTLEDMSVSMKTSLYTTFPGLDILYPYFDRSDFDAFTPETTAWGDSDKVNSYALKTVDDTAGLMRQEERLFVWPELVNHAEWAEEHVYPDYITKGRVLPRPEDPALEYQACSVETWPMMKWERPLAECEREEDYEFGDDIDGNSLGGLSGFDSNGVPVDFEPFDQPPAGMYSGDDLDQYEDDFVVEDGLVEYDEDGSDASDGLYGYDSDEVPIPGYPFDQRRRDRQAALAEGPSANFSDLEPESDEGVGEEENLGSGEEGSQGSESGDESENQGNARPVSVRNRPRRAVVSDDEDNEKDEDGGDEDDDVRQAPVRSRTRRTVISEEDEDEEDAAAEQAPPRRRARRAVVSEDEEDV